MPHLHHNILKLEWIRILTSMIFIIPVIVLFWQDHGLSMTQVMLLQSIYAIMVVVFELPTGYFADRLDRRTSLMLSAFLMMLGWGLYAGADGFLGFMMAEILLALAVSLISGADSAILYDTLLALGREGEHTRIYGRYDFSGYLAVAGSGILGSLLVPYVGYEIVIALTAPCMLGALLLSLILVEPPRDRIEVSTHHSALEDLVRMIRSHFHPSGPLLMIVVYSGLIYAFIQAVLWIYQPYFQMVHIPVELFGVIFATFQIVSAYASRYAHTIEGYLPGHRIFFFSASLLLISYLGMIYSPLFFGLFFIYLQQLIRGFQRPIIASRINALAPSAYRATLLSVSGLSNRLFYALMIPFVGGLIDQSGIMAGIGLLSVGVVILIIFLLVSIWRE